MMVSYWFAPHLTVMVVETMTAPSVVVMVVQDHIHHHDVKGDASEGELLPMFALPDAMKWAVK